MSEPVENMDGAGAPVLQLDNLEVGYRGRRLLPPVNLEIRRGELWSIIGQNGSGKTTLLRSILGLLPKIGGEVRLPGDAPIGYVPQRGTIDDGVPARVIDVVRGGIDRGWSFLRPLHVHRHSEDVMRALDDTNALKLSRRQYSELSEGQKQRVLMARSLASNPGLLILDEPTSAMDVVAEESVLELLAELRKRRDLAVIMVSHHLPVVARFSTHALLVDKDSGLVQGGPIEAMAESDALRKRYVIVLREALKHREEQAPRPQAGEPE